MFRLAYLLKSAPFPPHLLIPGSITKKEFVLHFADAIRFDFAKVWFYCS